MSKRLKSPGQIIGHYEVLGQWAQGQGAPVYVVRDVGGRSSQLFALRTLTDPSTPRAQAEAILAEAHAASLLEHLRIARVHEVGVEEDGAYAVSDFIPGESLASLLKNLQGEIPRPVAAAIARDLALSVHEAHTARDARGHPLRIAHGDLTAANVVFTHEGEMFLVDFGIHAEAPGRASGPADDVYALGLLFFEMLVTEKTPGGGAEVPLVISTPALRRAGRELESIVLRATAQLRNERYQSALEMAEALDFYVKERAARMDVKAEIARLMTRHFQHRARATRTLVARWKSQAGARRPSVSHPPAAAAHPAMPLMEPLPPLEGAVTEDVHRTGDLRREPSSGVQLMKIFVAILALLILAVLGKIGLHYLR